MQFNLKLLTDGNDHLNEQITQAMLALLGSLHHFDRNIDTIDIFAEKLDVVLLQLTLVATLDIQAPDGTNGIRVGVRRSGVVIPTDDHFLPAHTHTLTIEDGVVVDLADHFEIFAQHIVSALDEYWRPRQLEADDLGVKLRTWGAANLVQFVGEITPRA